MKMDYSMMTLRGEVPLALSGRYRYLVVLRGAGTLRIGDGSYTLSLHDAISVPAGVSGLFQCKAEGEVLLGCISLVDMDLRSTGCHVFSAEHTDMLRRVFYMGLDSQDREEPYYSDIQTSLDHLMFHVLTATWLMTRSMNPQVYEVLVKINAHFSEPEYDVRPDIAATGYTDNHFRKLFREETGVTPTEFITIRRIDKAIELFQRFRDRLPIKEIALQSGYQDPYYFSRQFKKRTGLSPQQYIAQI